MILRATERLATHRSTGVREFWGDKMLREMRIQWGRAGRFFADNVRVPDGRYADNPLVHRPPPAVPDYR